VLNDDDWQSAYTCIKDDLLVSSMGTGNQYCVSHNLIDGSSKRIGDVHSLCSSTIYLDVSISRNTRGVDSILWIPL